VSLPVPLRAPRGDGAVVAIPPLDQVGPVLHQNRTRLAADVELLFRPLSELQREARAAVLEAARSYLRQADEPAPQIVSDRLVLAGHQPELFHPGVWVKNFALQGLARRHQLTPVNLIVDNDTVKATVLRLPAGIGGASGVHVVAMPFDSGNDESPYEERRVHDEELFADLPRRAAEHTDAWPWQPLLATFWEHALGQRHRTTLLGERLVAARRSIERLCGCHNLELPVSALCRTEPFAWFACHIIANLPAFHQAHNEALVEYRKRHGIRSANHPVPDLGRQHDRLEAPFWAWRTEQGRRQRLLVRQGSEGYELFAGAEKWPSLPLAGGPRALVAAWRDLEARGFKVRCRALTTTLFSRLFLADLFIHGIGGAQYDQLTDELLRRVYRIEPPAFLILSATLLLPFPGQAVDAEQCRRLAHDERDLWWNPQRHLTAAADPAAVGLSEEKQTWMARTPATRRERRERFEQLRRLTGELRQVTADESRKAAGRRRACERALEVDAILGRRDYSFVLHPEARLRALCRQFLA
jgi:hypothetical protein